MNKTLKFPTQAFSLVITCLPMWGCVIEPIPLAPIKLEVDIDDWGQGDALHRIALSAGRSNIIGKPEESSAARKISSRIRLALVTRETLKPSMEDQRSLKDLEYFVFSIDGWSPGKRSGWGSDAFLLRVQIVGFEIDEGLSVSFGPYLINQWDTIEDFNFPSKEQGIKLQMGTAEILIPRKAISEGWTLTIKLSPMLGPPLRYRTQFEPKQ